MREFKVWYNQDHNTKKITKYFVTDSEGDTVTRAPVVEFPISQLHDDHDQKIRAYEYADYMNKIAKATQDAIDQTKLIEILKK